jgi:CO/xanthine dehydrogenase FAD-binding subunit
MPLEVARPESVRMAAAVLAHDGGARLVGGGTLVVRARNSGDLSIGKLVLSDGLGLDRIAADGDRIALGATVTMAQVLAHPDLAFLHPVAREIGGPAVRAMATIGGNLFARAPYGDFAVALLALGADVTTEGEDGPATEDLEAFLKARNASRGRIVTGVAFARPPKDAFRFAKVMRRHPHGAAVLSVAACLPLEAGTVKGARVAYGAMAPIAVRAHAVERALEGRALDAASIAAAVQAAGEGTAPQTDPFASAWYRSAVLPVHLARILKR